MLIKSFEKTALDSASASSLQETDEALLTRFTAILNALVAPPEEDVAAALIRRVIGQNIPASPQLEALWQMNRAPLLREKLEVLLGFGETMAHFHAYAVNTYLRPVPGHDDLSVVSARKESARTFTAIQTMASETLAQLQDAVPGDTELKRYEQRLLENADLKDTPFRGRLHENTYAELLAHFKLAQKTALAATLRLAETDIAYAIASGVHALPQDGNAAHMKDMRDLQAASVVTRHFAPTTVYPDLQLLKLRGVRYH